MVRLRQAGALLTCALLSAGGHAAETVVVRVGTPLSVTGGDDVAQLRHLAAGVGWEFEPNAETTAALKRVGMKAMRCINVDPVPGEFAADGRFVIGKPDRLDWHLAACQAIGADPHVIVGVSVHQDLRVREEEVKDRGPELMGLVRSNTFGPNDWAKFQAYCEAVFEYVLITRRFVGARFEVGNEPDIGGTIHSFPPRPANGSKALYEGYFELYRNVAAAASRFEEQHPGVKVRLGGPALAWAYTFRYGDFNWADRFVEDCGTQGLKLDFVGVHFYGNISSIAGGYEANYPPFTEMLKQLRQARDRWTPGVPIMLTEWGASYQTDLSASAAVNANHIGAAWCAAFLNAMLEHGVGGALYLVTTDLRQQAEDGTWRTVWGWPSLFANPNAVGKTVPKAPFHVFDMVGRLRGRRVEAAGGGGTVDCFVVADRAARTLQALVWNYRVRIPEGGVAVENARRETVTLRIPEAADLFGAAPVQLRRWLVSRTTSNAYGLFERGEPLDDRAQLQQVESRPCPVVDGQLAVSFAMPPSSVALVELGPPTR